MTRKVTVDIDDGIVLVIQGLVTAYGLIVASVFGRIWDYCTRENGECTASMETIGNDLGIDRATALRSAKKLCEEGYLEDLTPNLRNHPHTYRDTGKAGLAMTITARSGVAQGNTGVAHCNTTKNGKKAGVAQRNTTNGQNGFGVALCNTKAPGVAQDHMNLVVVVNSLTDSLTEQQQQTTRELIRAGVSEGRAAEFASHLSPERITLAIDVYKFMRHFKKARGSGYLIDFLDHRWSPPVEYIPADQRCQECWRAENDHADSCSRKRSRYLDDFICPHCFSHPCTCEVEQEPEEEHSA